MLVCSHCQSSNPDGTLMCNQCLNPFGSTANPVQVLPVRHLAMPAPPVRQVRLVVMENMQPTGSRLSLPDISYQGEILIGRNDLGNQIVVDIDLSPFGGFEKRVSRKHAKVFYQSGQVYLEDWNSQYGTYLNKQLLVTGEKKEIHSGDEVRFANLILKMEVV